MSRLIYLFFFLGLSMIVSAQPTATRTSAKSTAQIKSMSLKGATLVDTAQPESKTKQAVKDQETEIEWITFAEAEKRNKITKKKILVDVYTDWCGWCKRMDATTFKHPDVVRYVNENYYAIKFNAEQKEDIEFNGKKYKNNNTGTRSTHEFALQLLNNRTGYPTTVFMSEELEVIQPLPGYMEAVKLEPILHYFGSDSHKKMPWEAFEKDFQKNKSK